MKPLRPTSPKNRYINDIVREFKSQRLSPGRGVQMRRRSSATIIETRPGRGGSKSIGMVFRGEYNSGRLYKKSDCVKISGGITAGTYLCLTDMSAVNQSPWLGNPWVQLSKLLDQWL